MASYTSDMTISEMLAVRFADRGAPTQTEAAQIFRVSQATISRWKSGAQLPDRDKVAPLAGFLGIGQEAVITAIQRQAEKDIDALKLVLRLKKAHYEVLSAFRPRSTHQSDALAALDAAIKDVSDVLHPEHASGRGSLPPEQPIANDQFAMAAHDGDPASTKVGRKVNRPSPEPEPEGP